jgi:hypothetical protein
MTFVCTLDLKADTLKDTLEIDVISELYFGITRRITKFFSSLFNEDSPQVAAMYRYLARLHYYLTSLGMVSFLGRDDYRVELKCLALLYEERGDHDELSFRGYTNMSDILANHPKMSLDLLVTVAEECIKAIQAKINPNETSSDCFIRDAVDIYRMISTSPEVVPHFVNHRGSPHVIVRLKVSPRTHHYR